LEVRVVLEQAELRRAEQAPVERDGNDAEAANAEARDIHPDA